MVDWNELRRLYLDEIQPSSLPADLEIPALPNVVLEFSRRAKDPNAGPRDLGSIVERDAGLTCHLLRHVNSSWTGLRRKATSAQQAIAILGANRSAMFLLEKSLTTSAGRVRNTVLDLDAFWRSNLERGLFAREVAGLLGADADVAYTGAMLQDFLLPWLTAHAPDCYRDYLARLEDERSTAELVWYEGEHLFWDHAKEGARLLVQWGFPDELACCVLLHHAGTSLLTSDYGRTSVAAVAVSALLPDPLRQVPTGLDRLQQIGAAWPDFDPVAIARRVDAVVHAEASAVSAAR